MLLVELQALRLLDRDDAVLADLVHHLGDDLPDLRVARADGGDVGDVVGRLDRLAEALDLFDNRVDALLDAALETLRAAPAVTFFRPSVMIAWASTMLVVVPSPATSFVLAATSSSSWAPMFS